MIPTLPIDNRDDANKYAYELFDKLGMSNSKEHFPSELSVGECQRIAIIRALIHCPKLLLADAPPVILINPPKEIC